MGCRQGTIFLKMVASISSSLGITASIASGSVIERATFLTIWAKKRQVFVPKAATFSFHLHCCIFCSTISAHNLYFWMGTKPGYYRFCRTIRQQIDCSTPLQINENGAVCLAFFPCPVVNTQNAYFCWCWDGNGFHTPQECWARDTHSQFGGESLSQLPTGGKSNGLELFTEPVGHPSI